MSKIKIYLRIIIILATYVCYFAFLNHYLLPVYYRVYSYITAANYQFSEAKFSISVLCFAWFSCLVVFHLRNLDNLFSILMNLIMVLCIIPMLSIYAYIDYIDAGNIIFPFVFWSLMLLLLGYYKGKKNRQINTRKLFKFDYPKFEKPETLVLVLCGFAALVCWAWAGFPILTTLSDAIETRLQLRMNSMPTMLAYVFMILGGVMFPYLFVRFFSEKKIIFSIICLIVGLLLFSVNGMKTWLFLYLFGFLLSILCFALKKKRFLISICINVGIIIVTFACAHVYLTTKNVTLLSQFGRVVCIPNAIGFRSIIFFSGSENPFLFLRESILRFFFETPYPGGSDFYLDYGAESTINSARANNGLWGDAFRNFGLIGMVLYPFMFAKVFSILVDDLDETNNALAIFAIFLVVWNAVNVSFFTWLLTGGVIVLLLVHNFLKPQRKANINVSFQRQNNEYF